MCTLKETIGLQPDCALLFDEAWRLADSLLTSDSRRVPLPYFTQHTHGHSRAVERYLDALIFGGNPSRGRDFMPTPEEAMYLLSAAWLHDIGMMYGIFDGENPADLQGDPSIYKRHRDEHEQRTTRYLREKWRDQCHWSDSQKTYLAHICHYHRRSYDIDGFTPIEIGGTYVKEPVRLRVLAALLRFCDACHVDESRAPGPLHALYDSVGMPADSAQHWGAAELISEVSFDHEQRRVSLVAQIPDPVDFKLGRFDFRSIIDDLCRNLQVELDTVSGILMQYPNLLLREVGKVPRVMPLLNMEHPKRCLALWPYLLRQQTSATESMAAVVQILLFAITSSPSMGIGIRRMIDDVFAEAAKLRPFDFMVRNLKREVNVVLLSADQAGKAGASADTWEEHLKTCLVSFLDRVKKESQQAVEICRTLIAPQDALVVYGHSINTSKFLQETRRSRGGPVYIVDCRRPGKDGSAGEDENAKMLTLARDTGLDAKFVAISGLAAVLEDLKARDVPCKVLLGAHGVLPSGDLLCKTGSYCIATIGKAFGAEVFVLASPVKQIASEAEIRDMPIESGLASMSPSTGMSWMAPVIDKVPSNLVKVIGLAPQTSSTGTTQSEADRVAAARK